MFTKLCWKQKKKKNNCKKKEKEIYKKEIYNIYSEEREIEKKKNKLNVK